MGHGQLATVDLPDEVWPSPRSTSISIVAPGCAERSTEQYFDMDPSPAASTPPKLVIVSLAWTPALSSAKPGFTDSTQIPLPSSSASPLRPIEVMSLPVESSITIASTSAVAIA